MANSARVTGCTDSRLPFLITIISSRPRVRFKVSSATTEGKRSTNSRSTVYQIGFAAVLAGVVVLMTALPRKGIRIPGARDPGQARHTRRVGVRRIKEDGVPFLHVVADEIARLVVAHAFPSRAAVAGEVVDGVSRGLALHQPVARGHAYRKPLRVVTVALTASFSGSSSASISRSSGEHAACTSGRSSCFWYCCCGLSRRQ